MVFSRLLPFIYLFSQVLVGDWHDAYSKRARNISFYARIWMSWETAQRCCARSGKVCRKLGWYRWWKEWSFWLENLWLWLQIFFFELIGLKLSKFFIQVFRSITVKFFLLINLQGFQTLFLKKPKKVHLFDPSFSPPCICCFRFFTFFMPAMTFCVYIFRSFCYVFILFWENKEKNKTIYCLPRLITSIVARLSISCCL